MTIHTHHLLHSNKDITVTTPLMVVGVVTTSTMAVTITGVVSMAAAMGDMVDEGPPSLPLIIATTLNPQIGSLIVSCEYSTRS